MKKLLAMTPRVDAVFAANDPSAIGAMKAIWDAGLRVPEDIAVVGAGDIALGDLLRVPLTTVSWSREDQGRRAAELLLERHRSRADDDAGRSASSFRRGWSCARSSGGRMMRLAIVAVVAALPSRRCRLAGRRSTRRASARACWPRPTAYLNEAPDHRHRRASPRSAGGPHDFFSEGDYWWPDPEHPDGPYIQQRRR